MYIMLSCFTLEKLLRMIVSKNRINHLEKLTYFVAENETRDAELNRPYQAGVYDRSRDKTRDGALDNVPNSIIPVPKGAAAQSKAESKRLQWERERGRSGLACRSQTPIWNVFLHIS